MLSKGEGAAGARFGVLLGGGVALAAAAVLGILVLIAGDGEHGSLNIECRDSVVWRGVTYVSDGELRVTRRASLGNGQIPCRGGNAERGAGVPRSARIQRFGDVPPAVAIAVEGKEFAYFADGFLVPLRSHPLHRRVYGSDARPRPPGRRCRGSYTWDATVVSVIPPRGEGIVVRRRNGGEVFLRVHARTRVRGLSKHGHPYLRRGDLVRLRGVTCPRSNLVVNIVRRRV